MRIALIVPGFSANEQDWCIPALLDFVRVLARQADVHVFTLRWPPREQVYSVYGATVHALGGKEHLGVNGALRLYARAWKAIAHEHERAPFTAIHAFWADEPGWVAAWAGWRLNIPAIISIAGGELIGLRDIGYGVQLLPGRKMLIHASLHFAKKITVGSKYLLEIARSRIPSAGEGRLVIAPLGVDVKRFFPSRERQRGNVILNVGSLHPVKNQQLLLRAIKRVPQTHLEIAGVGSLSGELSDRALSLGVADRVKFLGEVNHGDMPAVYQSASVFAQSSRHEAQGMAVLEAAACGAPSVGTRVGVLPEVGILANDEVDFANHLEALLRDEDYRLRLGEEARAKVLTGFTLEQSVNRFVNLYNG